MHATLDLPAIRFDASNALFCKCGAILAATVNGQCIGLKGIQAVIEEESRCGAKGIISTDTPIPTIKPTPRKKQRQLFEKSRDSNAR